MVTPREVGKEVTPAETPLMKNSNWSPDRAASVTAKKALETRVKVKSSLYTDPTSSNVNSAHPPSSANVAACALLAVMARTVAMITPLTFIIQSHQLSYRHSPSGLPSDTTTSSSCLRIKSLSPFSVSRAVETPEKRAPHAANQCRAGAEARLYGALDRPIVPLSFSSGVDRGKAHDGGARIRRIAGRMSKAG